MQKQPIIVKVLPDWKSPCPICNAKYPQPSISHRKDGTRAWCNSCGTNWEKDKRPEGWDKTAEILGAKTDYNSNKINIATEMLIQLQQMNKTLIEILDRLKELTFKDYE